MPFEMPETGLFGRSHEVPVAEDSATPDVGSPTPLALAGSGQPDQAADGAAGPETTESASTATQVATEAPTEAPSAAPTEAEPGVALAPAESPPLLASREAAFVAGYPSNRQPATGDEAAPAEPAPETAAPSAPAVAPDAAADAASSEEPDGAPDSNPKAEGSYKVQLASYVSMEVAEQEWTRLQTAYPELLGDKTLSVREAKLDAGDVVYGIRTGAFPDLDSAKEFCQEMATRDEDCMVVGGPGTTQRVVSQSETKDLADVQKDALFEQFLQWQRRRSYGIDENAPADADESELFEQFIEWQQQRSE